MTKMTKITNLILISLLVCLLSVASIEAAPSILTYNNSVSDTNLYPHQQVKTNIIFNVTQTNINLLENSGFESWSNGTTLAPDGWTLAAGTIARAISPRIGTYCVELSTTATLQMRGLDAYYLNRKVTFGCWVKSANTVENAVFIRTYDGSGYATSYYQNSGNWEFLTITDTVLIVADWRHYLQTSGANAVGYFDGAILVEGEAIDAGTHYLEAIDTWTWLRDGTYVSNNNPTYTTQWTRPGQKNISVYGTSATGVTETVSWYPKIEQEMAGSGDVITEINTSAYDSIMDVLSSEDPDYETLLFALTMPHTSIIGSLLYVILYGVPFLFMWLSQGSAKIPAVLACMLAPVLLGVFNPDYIGISILLILLTLFGVVYTMYKSRGT